MSKYFIVILTALVVLVASNLWISRHSRDAQLSPPAEAPTAPADAQFSTTDQTAGSAELADTVWGKELLAQKHEAIFIQLWDHLRTNGNPAAVLQKFTFGELLLGTLDQPRELGNRISTRRTVAPHVTLRPQEWRQRIAELRNQGYQLEQSEWRHPKFHWNTNGAHVSSIVMWLHLANTNRQERIVVRGELNVYWRAEEDLEGPQPFPERIEATHLELLTRKGETPFHHVIAESATRESAPFLEPLLQLYDLDGDGLSEIILARRNRVFWNKGVGVFQPAQLCQEPLTELGTALLADFDGDAHVDLLCADRSGLALFTGDARGQFARPSRRIEFTDQDLPNPLVLTAGDIDRDNDLDLWLAQYKVPYQGGQMPSPYDNANDGYASYLLLNNGRGEFTDATESSGLASKRFRRTYSTSFVDLDNDADLDLVVVSDFAGVDIHLNNGRGVFSDVTSTLLQENRAFGMAHTFGDYDRDELLDLFVIGMNSFVAERLSGLGLDSAGNESTARAAMSYGNRLYFRRGDRFEPTPMSDQAARTGWSWAAATGDFDNDGDSDVYIVNGHISARSVADYEPQFWLYDIYPEKIKDNPALSAFFRAAHARFRNLGTSYGGYEKNRFLANLGGQSFVEIGYLMGVSLEQDCRNAVADDLDADGKLDLLTTTFMVWPSPKQELHLFPNLAADLGNWIGVRLREHGRGFSPIGAKVHLNTSARKQIRHFVTGDSYRSQHAPTAHFGLGNEPHVESIDVIWPNGKQQRIGNPAINRYHSIVPEL